MARRANIQKKLIPLELYALSWVTKWWGRYNFPRRKIRKKYLDKIPLFRKAVLEGAASRREETEREIVRNDYSAVHAAMKWLRVRRRKEKLNSWEEVADWLRTVRIPMTVRSVSGKEYTVSRSCPIPDVSVLELAKSLGPSPALAHELARLTVQERLVVSEATVKKAPSEKPRKRKHPSRHRAKPATPEQCWLVSAFLDLSVERPSAIGRRLQTRILETLLVTGYDSRAAFYLFQVVETLKVRRGKKGMRGRIALGPSRVDDADDIEVMCSAILPEAIPLEEILLTSCSRETPP